VVFLFAEVSMGCDIHMYVERVARNGSKKWVHIPDSEGPKHPYYKEGLKDADPNASEDDKKRHEQYMNYFNHGSWSTGRNYWLFGLMATVRAYHVVPIAEPKGVPKNMSPFVKKEWKDGQGDWHTPSWFTAKELLEAKDKPIQLRACLSMAKYKEYLQSGKTQVPEDDLMWGRWRIKDEQLISNEEMERRVNLAAFWDGTEYYTDVYYTDPKYTPDLANTLFNSILPRMLEIEPDPEKIRIVFWFDN
jgi:hypothetical protein